MTGRRTWWAEYAWLGGDRAAAGVLLAADGDRLTTVTADASLHAHLSEQIAENEACLAHYGRTPAEHLDDAGVLCPRTTVVHATHLTGGDVRLLGRAGVSACFCVTTERDLSDGIARPRNSPPPASP